MDVMFAPSNTPRSPCEKHGHPLNLDLHVHELVSSSLFALQVKICSLYPVLDTSMFGLG